MLKDFLIVFSLILFFMILGCSNPKSKTGAPTVERMAEEDETPSITKAKIKSFVVPDSIEGNKYIKAHKVYILEDAGSWSK